MGTFFWVASRNLAARRPASTASDFASRLYFCDVPRLLIYRDKTHGLTGISGWSLGVRCPVIPGIT